MFTYVSKLLIKGGPLSIQVKNQIRTFRFVLFLINTRLVLTPRNYSRVTLGYKIFDFIEKFSDFFLSKIDKSYRNVEAIFSKLENDRDRALVCK